MATLNPTPNPNTTRFYDPRDWIILFIDLVILTMLAVALWQGWFHFDLFYYIA